MDCPEVGRAWAAYKVRAAGRETCGRTSQNVISTSRGTDHYAKSGYVSPRVRPAHSFQGQLSLNDQTVRRPRIRNQCHPRIEETIRSRASSVETRKEDESRDAVSRGARAM